VEPSYDLIHQIGHRILDGHRFAPGETWLSPFGPVRFGAVDPIQYRLNTFNRWNLMAEHGHLRVTELEALQVFVPSTWFGDGHALLQPDLVDPSARVNTRNLPNLPNLPNRAARRARRR
jgi:hypothetical protein